MPLGFLPTHLLCQVGCNATQTIETQHRTFNEFSNLTEKGMKC